MNLTVTACVNKGGKNVMLTSLMEKVWLGSISLDLGFFTRIL